MYNYELDTSILPEIWITWSKKDDTKIYMDGATGKRQTTAEDWMKTPGIYWRNQNDSKICVKSGSNAVFAYAKYHEDSERLELAAVTYDTTRGEYAHEWKFAGERFFLGKDKTCQLLNGSTFTNSWRTLFKNHSTWGIRGVLQMLTRQHYNNYFVAEFKKFIGANYFTIGNGSTIDIKYGWHIQKWYDTVQKCRSKGKAQKLTDQLIAIPVSSIDGFAEKYPEKKLNQYTTLMDIIYFEKLNDDWCVLRLLHRDLDNSLSEVWRVYIGKDGTTRIVSKNINGWIPSKQVHTTKWYSNYAYIANKDEAILQCPRIKYILSAKELKSEEKEVDFLITALRFPEIEQLCKFNCGTIAEYLSTSHTPKADLKENFGGYYNDKEKNLLRKIGMTKQQLDFYVQSNTNIHYYGFDWENTRALMELRKMFGDNLTHLDINSFKKYLIACREWRRFKGYREGSYIFNNLNIDAMKLFKNLVRLMNKNSNIFTIVYDAMSSYNSLEASRRFDIDWYFDDVSDAVRAHDAFVELLRIQNEERRALWSMQEAERRKKEEEKRKKLDKARQFYEYEDDQFIIRLPKDANEIVQEGSMQHICIGGYVSRHSLGDTNLFFLRRKSELNKPFYAIEMNNSQNIVQIHGFGNKWLGNNPEAIPTVIRWLRKHGIKCNNEILTCKATGYGRSNDYVPMPVVD